MFENAAFLLAFHDRDDVLLTLPVKTTLFFGERTMKLFSAKSANRRGSKNRRRSNCSANSRKSSFSPRLEALEDRVVLSAISVLNTADSGPDSLREAVLYANENPGPDEIQFAVGLSGTIGLTSGQLEITDELTIDGPGADVLTVSGSGMSRVFLVTDTNVTIDDITIADGLATDGAASSFGFTYSSGGGLLNLGGNVTLNRVHVVDNAALAITQRSPVAIGGGVANWFGASMTVNQSTFADNQATGAIIGAGGAIAITGEDSLKGSLTVNDSSFSDNQAVALTGINPAVQFSGFGGGGAVVGSTNVEASITNSQFANNTAKGGDGVAGTGQGGGFSVGGAIQFGGFGLEPGAGPAKLDVAGSTFSGNQSIGGNGADGPDGVRGGNGAPGYSGAIHLFAGAETTVTKSSFKGNQAVTGDGGKGGDGADGGDSGNYGDTFLGGGSGAIRSDGAALAVIDSFFSGNVVQGGNGGQGGSGANGGNGSDNDGGAIAVTTSFGNSSLEMTNTTLINNSVIAGHGGNAGEGGGDDGIAGSAIGGGLAINISDAGNNAEVTLTSSRFVRNSVISEVSAVGGAIANVDGGTLTVDRSSIVNNRASSAGDALGGGIYNDATSNVTLTHSNINANRASGGTGIGGGVYNAGSFSVDKRTKIRGNKASTSHDNVFGDLTLLDDVLAIV
jgi:hypothetical protein